jgi:tetratricopeptide (TPR) repeat protein
MEPQRTFTPQGAPVRDGALLPARPPVQLIGRSRELNAMQSTLKIGASVFLSGGSGIGKTALAATVASTYVDSNIGGVLWLNLYEEDFESLLARVGRAYNALPSGDLAAYTETVRSILAKNQPLIVLDGIVDIDAVREFLRSCATGVPTIIANEFTAAGPWTPIELEELSQEDSRELLKQVSELTDPLYQDDIAGLCRFLSGNPLALELAGRLVTTEDATPAELLASLPSSTGHDGHLLMMTLSFKKLQASAQALLLVLSALYTGSASVELLSDLSNLPPIGIIPLMQQLVAKGLARESSVNGQIHYTLHEVAQEYTRNWLRQYQHLNGAENRALRAVIKFVERHVRDGGNSYSDLAIEMPNIMGAAAFATASGQANALREIINLLGNRAGDFITARGFQPEMNQLRKLNTLLSPARPLPVTATLEATQAAPAISEPLEDSQATPRVEMRTSPPKPRTLPPSADPLDTTQATQITPVNPMEAVDETQPSLRNEPEPTSASPVIPEPPRTFGDTDVPTERSLPNIKGQIDNARARGDSYTQANLLHAIGRHYAERGDPAQGMAYEKEALELYESMDDMHGVLGSLDTLASITARLDDAEGALLYATRGINIAESLGDKARLGRLQMRLADVRVALGDMPAAIQTYTQAAETLRNAEDWFNIGVVMSKLGTAYIEMRQFREGLMMLEQALVIFQKEQKNDHISRVLGSIGAAYSGLQQWDQADNYFTQALTLARKNHDQPSEAAFLSNLAYTRRMLDNWDAAIDAYWQALHVAYQTGDTHLQAELSYELGSLLIEHPNTIYMGQQLLRESDSLFHSDEAQQLLKRASKRIERASKAGINLPPAEDSRQYAAKSYQNIH